jgi:hypothetical protein
MSQTQIWPSLQLLVILSWCQPHLGHQGQIFITSWFVNMANPFLTKRLTWRVQLLLALASGVLLDSDFQGGGYHILMSTIRDSFQHGWSGPRTYPRNRDRIIQMCTQILGSLSVICYDSQGCGVRVGTAIFVGSLHRY